jgi:uncharacterized protein (DUF1697 family)
MDPTTKIKRVRCPVFTVDNDTSKSALPSGIISRMADTQLALLRGINVGGKNKLPMRDLAAMFEEAGCENVRTFIQSGNVIFTATSNVSKRLAGVVTLKIADRFGHQVPVILRTAQQLRDVISNNPFPQAEDLHVMFLADRPSPAKIASLDPDRSPPDVFLVRGQEIYLHLLNGAARTKLTNAWFDSKLGTVSTGRNWRTVNKLLDLM